ncbi:MAG: CoA-binding protein [Chloroflexi bacterium]|nr:CoA-binding protein [Chloroflexota bacterium]
MDDALAALRDAKTVAVVGLDARTSRTAYRIAEYLQRAGYKIIPVNLGQPGDVVLGEPAYGHLRDVQEHVDLVDVFVRSENTGPVIDDAIAIRADAIWLQVGIANDDGIRRARAAGLVATQDRCTMVEHRHL